MLRRTSPARRRSILPRPRWTCSCTRTDRPSSCPCSFSPSASRDRARRPPATDSGPGSGLDEQEVDALVADLRDPEARERLIARLEALRSAEESPAAPDLDPEQLMLAGEDLIGDLVSRARNVEPAWVLRNVLLTLGVLVLAWLARWLLRWLLLRIGDRIAARIRAARQVSDGTERQAKAERDPGASAAAVAGSRIRRGCAAADPRHRSCHCSAWPNSVGGGELGRRLVLVLTIAMVTMVAWNVADAIIDRSLWLHMGRLQRARSQNRVNTVGPLLRGTAGSSPPWGC
ncbi:MAG: hypothetical protein U5R48_17835 [Gammaproteobacteria bacterium]|nr:hypothetical protein [Gammaproteobacteria bacterium]